MDDVEVELCCIHRASDTARHRHRGTSNDEIWHSADPSHLLLHTEIGTESTASLSNYSYSICSSYTDTTTITFYRNFWSIRLRMPSPTLHGSSRTRKWLLSSPPVEWAMSQLQEIFINALRQGPIPQHVAFVMDGNRRFARSNHIETVEGHNMGFEALAKVI